ncbi:4Fe-4S ferredoxin [Gordonibacter sp. 28C]|uniref:4Fe-4S dicluster domain-containing protein n=1 Tax=Gordonibacter sp. 28C TaxID=2078569 RepID=UPI000DF79957|nr:4Fe-4S dicluster domain-containing protein [Gordonibacter sp. 28C]RDB61396.1 4Fe-4S ferredoxin [Gordonibacter sp. 28C]
MRNTLVIDLDRCIGCYSCAVACKTENDIPLGTYWSKVVEMGPTVNDRGKKETYWLPVQCQQCENAPCVHVCPTGASYRDKESGIVLIDKEKCIGCKYCMMACPYGVRTWSETEQCVEKCTLCGQRTAAGDEPACVAACCAEARFYGDLDDPSSDVARAVAATDPESVHELMNVGNNPTTAYLLSKSVAVWKGGDN